MKKGKIKFSLLLILIMAFALSISASADWLDYNYEGQGGISSQYDDAYLADVQVDNIQDWSDFYEWADSIYQSTGDQQYADMAHILLEYF